MMIYIYDDGIHNNTHLYIAIAKTIPQHSVGFCTSGMILAGCLDTCDLLIMPGGADLYYCEKLDGKGNQIIRDFVANGGTYLGICAGAYYGCTALDWNRGEINGTRELAFYQGTATGPVYDWVEYPDSVYDGSWKHAATLETKGGLSFTTLYNGGPVFNEPTDTRSHVIARYSDLPDTPPAIVGGTFGKGRYILSSPHLEKFGHLPDDGLYKLLNKSYERERKTLAVLLPQEQKQQEFFKTILEQLL